MQKILFLVLTLVNLSAFAQTKSINIDKAKSKISFIGESVFNDGAFGYTVEGVFNDFSAEVQMGEKVTDSKIQMKIKIDSLRTKSIHSENNASGLGAVAVAGILKGLEGADSFRDKHLMSSDYFDAANFPEATFRSLNITEMGTNEYKMRGKLTIHGISQTGEFSLKMMKQYMDEANQKHTVYEASTKFNRNDFGVGVTAGEVVVFNQKAKVKEEIILKVTLDMIEASK
jgi:polyisoprenoid-binding protein YceI